MLEPLYLFAARRADHEPAAPGCHSWGRRKFGQSPAVGNASTDNGSRPPNLLITCSMLVQMDERQKLFDDLARRLTVRDLTTDEQARSAIDERIRHIENRLAEIDQTSESDYRRWY
jgi:hypothetical protein